MTMILLATTVIAAPPQSRVSRAVQQVFEASKSLPINYNDGIGWGVDAYKMYGGDGSIAQGWPAMSQWVSYQQMYVLCVYN